MKRRQNMFVAVLAVFGLFAAACSEDAATDSGSTTESSAASGGTEPTDDSSGEGASADDVVKDADLEDSSIEHGLAYTGGPGGEASGDPIVIGYVNQEGGTVSFPEASIGAEAAVWFANTYLGGVGGRPIELAKCTVTKEEDGQKCAQEMIANPDVEVVLVGALNNGSAPLLDGLSGKKPVFIANPLTTPDFVATDAFAFSPGAPGVVTGLSIFAAKYLADIVGNPIQKVAVVFNDNPIGQIAFGVLTKPVLEKFGITDITGVAVPDTAGPQEMATAIQSAGAQDADVFIPLVVVQSCIGVYEALKTLEIETPVVTSGLCFGIPMQVHLREAGEGGKLPDGWYFGGYGYSYDIRGNADLDSYVDTVFAFAAETGLDPNSFEYTGFGGPTFGTIMLLLQFLNGGSATGDDFRTAAKGFAGPMWGVVGPQKCGANPTFPSLCGFQIGVQQQQGTEYASVMDGYNGRAIDIQAEQPN
ncbi:MAG: hypothetical protein RLZ37_1525 [Actinomycetota bacterium]